MQVEYFIECALREDPVDRHHYYQPIGVWAHGLGGGLNVCGMFLAEETDAQEKADWLINDLIERDVRTLPPDWLARKADGIGLYQGDASPIYVTEGQHCDDIAERVLALLTAGKPLGDPPLPPPAS